jgi:hypothetical protein
MTTTRVNVLAQLHMVLIICIALSHPSLHDLLALNAFKKIKLMQNSELNYAALIMRIVEQLP